MFNVAVLPIRAKFEVCCGWPVQAPFFLAFGDGKLRDIAGLRTLVENLAMPLVEAQGLEIWGLEIVPGPVLRICLYVDRHDGEVSDGSATIDQCESISRQLGLALDVEDCIDQSWELEVSSPGLNRRFFTLEQMRPYLGDVVEARLSAPLPGGDRKAWRGRLKSVEPQGFVLEPCSVAADGVVVMEAVPAALLPWRDVIRARREHIFAMPEKPGKQKRKSRRNQARKEIGGGPGGHALWREDES